MQDNNTIMKSKRFRIKGKRKNSLSLNQLANRIRRYHAAKRSIARAKTFHFTIQGRLDAMTAKARMVLAGKGKNTFAGMPASIRNQFVAASQRQA